MNSSEMVRNLLENFEIVGVRGELAIIPRYPAEYSLRDNIQAAIIASGLCLSSIDYAKRKYCREKYREEETETDPVYLKYLLAYKSAKEHVARVIGRLFAQGKPLPPNGVFGASLVLERLPYSFFCAHLLYELGHRYEGHAVSRMILEQIAWAHAAYKLDDISAIKGIVTTKAVTGLKKTIPECGVLYGFLSKKTHLDYQSHSEFLRVENQKNTILHTQYEFYEYAQIILYLADAFAVVWELSQRDYIEGLESIVVEDSVASIRQDRPFLKTIEERLAGVEKAANKAVHRIADKSGSR